VFAPAPYPAAPAPKPSPGSCVQGDMAKGEAAAEVVAVVGVVAPVVGVVGAEEDA